MGVQSLGQEDPLEEVMAIHSSVLAWRIPWTEESGRLQSIGSQRVRHDWSDLAHTYDIYIYIYMCVYIYIYISVCVCVYIYIYIYMKPKHFVWCKTASIYYNWRISHWPQQRIWGMCGRTSVISFCLFRLSMGFSRQEYWSSLSFPSPVDHFLSELSTIPIHLGWPYTAWLIVSLS